MQSAKQIKKLYDTDPLLSANHIVMLCTLHLNNILLEAVHFFITPSLDPVF